MEDLKFKDEQRVFNDAMEAYEEARRERAIKALFESQSWNSDMNDLNVIIRAFYWVKTFVCLRLKRTYGSYLDDNTVNIISYDESSYPDGSSWESVWVSTKLFSGWQVCVASDGT